jgi:hypothetical protein
MIYDQERQNHLDCNRRDKLRLSLASYINERINNMNYSFMNKNGSDENFTNKEEELYEHIIKGTVNIY